MKNTSLIIAFLLISAVAFAQYQDPVIGRPDLSKNEIGLSFGNTSGIGNGILLSFNRYLSEKHILHFNFSPAFSGGAGGFGGTFEFWNEYRKHFGKTRNAFFSHGLEFNIGDRNRNLNQITGEPIKTAFASGLGYNIGFGHIINDRLTFTVTLKPRLNYYRLNDNGISHSLKRELNLNVGINYRFK